jgi:hypothetical protein
MSQAVVSQWLSQKYHGNVHKVDTALQAWLDLRKSGRAVQHNADDASSVLRVRRDNAATVGEMAERRKAKQMNKKRGSASKGGDGIENGKGRLPKSGAFAGLSSPQAASFLTSLGALGGTQTSSEASLPSSGSGGEAPAGSEGGAPPDGWANNQLSPNPSDHPSHQVLLGKQQRGSEPFEPVSAPMKGTMGGLLGAALSAPPTKMKRQKVEQVVSESPPLATVPTGPGATDEAVYPAPELSARGRNGAALLAHSLARGLPAGHMIAPTAGEGGRMSLGTEQAWAGLQSTPCPAPKQQQQQHTEEEKQPGGLTSDDIDVVGVDFLLPNTEVTSAEAISTA